MIYIATDDWYPEDRNPFSENGEYGGAWSCFIYDDTINNYSNVYPGAKVYTLRVAPESDAGNVRLFDFLRYELSYHRNVIVKSCKGVDAKMLIHAFYNSNAQTNSRVINQTYMVHSTTLEAWESIQKQGALLSPTAIRGVSCRRYFSGYVSRCKCLDTDNVYAKSA